jgi:hypothetical protein
MMLVLLSVYLGSIMLASMCSVWFIIWMYEPATFGDRILFILMACVIAFVPVINMLPVFIASNHAITWYQTRKQK